MPGTRTVAYSLGDGPGLYEVTKNPLYAWEALHAQRAVGAEISNWILEYFDRSAERLLSLATISGSGAPSSSAIAEALDFKRPGRSGRGTALSDYTKGRLARLITAAEVYLLVHDEGHKPDVASELVAQDRKAHRSTIARYYREHVEIIGVTDRLLAFFVARAGLRNIVRAIRKGPAANEESEA